MPFKSGLGLGLACFLSACASENASQPTFACDPSEASVISFDPADMPCVQLEMAEDDFIELGLQTRFGGAMQDQLGGAIGHLFQSCTEPYPDPFVYFPSSVRIDGVSAENVGVRKKGFVGSVLKGSDTRPSLKIKADKFESGQLMGDVSLATFNNNLTDASRMRTCLTYSVFQDAGYPTPQCNVANVMVNGVSLGAYTHVEPIQTAFLLRAFGNDSGSLYESALADFTRTHLAEGLGRWDAKTEATDPSTALLLAVTEALEAPDESLEAELDAVLDVDLFLRFWALETLVNHGDGHNSAANNSYVYFDPDNGDRAVFIPWGPDDAMQPKENPEDGAEPEPESFVNAALSSRLSRHPDLHQRYLDRLAEMLETVWDEDTLLARMTVYRENIETAEAYPAFDAAVSVLEEWILGRRAEMEAHIEEGGLINDAVVDSCFSNIDTAGLLTFGELTTTASYSCATGRAKASGWLAVFGIVLLSWRCRRRRP